MPPWGGRSHMPAQAPGCPRATLRHPPPLQVAGLREGLFTRLARQLAREQAGGGEVTDAAVLEQAGQLGGRLVGLFPQALQGGGAQVAAPLLVLHLQQGSLNCWVR